MTNGQEDIVRYLNTNHPVDTVQVIGDNVIRIKDETGETKDLTINIFGDILEKTPDGRRRVVAVSDLPHNLDDLPMYARPKTWKGGNLENR